MNKDYRYQRTEKHIIEACKKLSKTKNIYSLTVSEIAQEAEINRITFYSHYENIDALMDHIENINIEEYASKLMPVTDLISNPHAYLERYIKGFDDDPYNLLKHLLEKESFVNKSINYIVNKILEEYNDYDDAFKKQLIFIMYGLYGIRISGEFDNKTMDILADTIKTFFSTYKEEK